MHFQHASEIWRDFPELVAGVIHANGIMPAVDVTALADPYHAIARARLATATEGELPEIQAWRRTFAAMGLKPTQYRCAAEALLRRFRKEGSLPAIHPLIDLCNAVSMAYAIPVAVFDVSRVDRFIEVRYAQGDERYETFGGEVEQPPAGEVIFADAAGNAHARRWTNRQSGRSAVRETTSEVLIVAEALHPTAATDVPAATTELGARLRDVWGVDPSTANLDAGSPRFTF